MISDANKPSRTMDERPPPEGAVAKPGNNPKPPEGSADKAKDSNKDPTEGPLRPGEEDMLGDDEA